MYHTDDTIAAIASGAAGAARGIVRLSGPAVVSLLETCFRPHSGQSLRAVRTARVLSGRLQLAPPALRELEVEVYLWPTAQSYTRQCVAEIHTLGSPPLLSAVLGTLCAAGARPAEPGEFTLRAFLAGRLDLTQAEAVLGLIDARGDEQFQAALVQLAGGLAEPLKRLRGSLLDLLAQLEAGLDFAEEDIQFITSAQIDEELAAAADILTRLGCQLADRSYHDEMPRAVLIGWPNVGKSSLFSALSRQAALVSAQPGTTRDYLIANLDLGSLSCQLVDTAGIEPDLAAGTIALAAQQLAAAQQRTGDIRVLCLDSSRPLNAWEREEMRANLAVPQLVVLTKCDGPQEIGSAVGAIRTSAVTGLGLTELRAALRIAAVQIAGGETSAALTAQRCSESLRTADLAVARARELNRLAGREELIACDLRLALAELGKVAGSVYTDDILDRIFSRFCIGK